jgi:hypothetical protein
MNGSKLISIIEYVYLQSFFKVKYCEIQQKFIFVVKLPFMKYLIVPVVAFFLFSCNAENKEEVKSDPLLEKIAGKDYAKLIEIPTTKEGQIDTAQIALITFEESVFEFDTINEGDVIEHTFNFTNPGKKPLFILQTNSSCGCTVANYSKEAIQPGESGSISISFNSKGKSGQQNRKISVITNSYPNEKLIMLKGFVKQLDS